MAQRKTRTRKRTAAPPTPKSSPAEQEARKKRARNVLRGLRKLYPDATCELDHADALGLLVATILSAQSTDETVNKVTPELFAQFPDAGAIAAADPAQIEAIVHPTGFFRQKTKSVQRACRMVVEQFGGEVPDTMDELLELPGVARKTANVLLGTWFGKNEGVVVDTHVGRLSHKLDLTWTSRDTKDAVRIERDLMEVVTRKQWTFFAHALILHGRRVCKARRPQCSECTLARHCPSAELD